jgi:O-antigen ligase
MIDRSVMPASRPDNARRPGVAGVPRKGIGFFFWLLLVYLFFEYGRPPNPLGIPMLISILSLGGWLVRQDKRWSRQAYWFLAFLGVMAVGTPLAVNTFAAFWQTYGMAVVLLCICVPLPSVVTSVPKIRVWIYAFLTVALYVAGNAIFRGGLGPSGASGGQDENYVAAMMGMAISFAYFSIFAETRRVGKVLLALSIIVFCAAMVSENDVSRGGFLGLCAVTLYCLVRSRKRLVGLVGVALIALTMLVLAGPAYWDEIATIRNTDEGTADLRLEVWKIGMRMFEAHPVFGVGPGGFRWVVGQYQSPEQLEKFGRNLGGSIIAHSLFVELLAELGIAGAVVVFALLWRTWSDLRQVLRSATLRSRAGSAISDVDRLRCYADAVIGGIVACLVNGAFLSLLYYSYLWLFIALGSAITHVYRSQIAAQRAA